METILKRDDHKAFWVLKMSENDINAFGEPNVLTCRKCKGFLTYPFYYCVESMKIFCKDCEIPKSKTVKINDEPCEIAKHLTERSFQHSHFCIRDVETPTHDKNRNERGSKEENGNN